MQTYISSRSDLSESDMCKTSRPWLGYMEFRRGRAGHQLLGRGLQSAVAEDGQVWEIALMTGRQIKNFHLIRHLISLMWPEL
jgi:hypothetical protein